MSNLEVTATIKSLVDNSTLGVLPFTFDESRNCYVCEVDINDLDMPKMSEARVYITLESEDTGTTGTYDIDTIYVFNTDHEYICDRTQEDVDKVKDIRSKWLMNTISTEEKAEWNAGMKGALNASDITRIQDLTDNVLDWYIKKFNSFNSSHNYYINALTFYSSVIPDGLFFYKAGLTTMITQLNKLFTWLRTQPYTDMPDTFDLLLLRSGYYLTYGGTTSLSNATIEHTNYSAWNDVEILLYILFLTVISYNRNIAKTTAKDFIYHGPEGMSSDYSYCGESFFAGGEALI